MLLRHVRAVSTSNDTFISELEKCMLAVHELISESKELSGRLDSLLQERQTELDAVRRACPVSTLQSTRFRAKLSCALRSAFLRKANVETERSSIQEVRLQACPAIAIENVRPVNLDSFFIFLPPLPLLLLLMMSLQVDQLRSQRFVHTLLSNSFRERLEES